ncbi:MAG: response regulator [Nitrospiraceae bacterium]|nr:response regulator [Nitrospiraceae bacterium]
MGQNNPNILFVDDEQHILSSLKRLFMDEPYNIFTAPSGTEALELLKDTGFAVIISDQRMPGMSGSEFLEKAKQMQPDTVRMVLTGYADINAAINAINIGGASRYLTKPWNDNEIIMIVRDAAEKFNLLAENKRLTDLTIKQNEELKKWSTELEFYVQQHTIDLSKRNKELADLNKKMQQTISQIIVSFSSLVELRDKSMHSHSSNVALISSEIAKRMSLPEEDTKNITTAAQLHDIGKIGITDLILIKNPSQYNSEEIHEYRKHPVRGQAAIDAIDIFRETGLLIRHHHENIDGSGFPDMLRGDQIPLGSRIIHIADAFDRLTNGTAVSLSTEDAISKIKSGSGILYDTKIISYLIEAAREKLAPASTPKDNIEAELKPKDLAPGMTVSRDIRTGTGLLLLKKYTELNSHNIETLRRSYHIDPSSTGVFVWVKRK